METNRPTTVSGRTNIQQQQRQEVDSLSGQKLKSDTAAVVEKLKDMLPSIKILDELAQAVVDFRGAASAQMAALKELVEEMQEFLEMHRDDQPKQATGRRDALESALHDIRAELETVRSKSGVPTASLLNEYVEQAKQAFLIYKLEYAKEDYNLNFEILAETVQDELSTILDMLKPVENARFDAAIGRSRCFPGTRTATLNKLCNWARKGSFQKQVLWLSGGAGCGKSTIAQTVAEMLFLWGCLDASFFCSRSSKHRSDVKQIFPTIAYQLATSRNDAAPKFRTVLIRELQANRAIVSSSQLNQFQKLIATPARESGMKTVVMFDGLDECTDERAAYIILSILSAFSSEVETLKFIVTTCSTTTDTSNLLRSMVANTYDCDLSGEAPARSAEDISLFLRTTLSSLSVSQDSLTALAHRVDQAFIVASTAVQVISRSGTTASDAVERLLNMTRAQDGENTPLDIDDLYRFILADACSQMDKPSFLLLLGLLVVSREPLSLATLSEFMGTIMKNPPKLMVYKAVLSSLQPVLHFSEEGGDIRNITFHHKSFLDFLIDPARHRVHDQNFHIDESLHHNLAVLSCLKHMNKTLKKNVCGQDRYAPNNSIDMKVRDERIGDTLRYSCRYWSDHVLCDDKGDSPEHSAAVKPDLRLFLSTHQLHWIEVLGLLGDLSLAGDALEKIQSWLINMDVRDYRELLIHVTEARRFLKDALDAAKQSVLHIYHSILPFTPQFTSSCLQPVTPVNETKVAADCGGQQARVSQTLIDKEVTVSIGREAWRNGPVRSFETSDWIHALTFSHGGSNIDLKLAASGDGFCNLYDCSSLTASPEVPKSELYSKHFYRSVISATFSSDNGFIAAATRSKVSVWNCNTWEEVTTSRLDNASSISFHPSKPSLLLVGSENGSIALWDYTVQGSKPSVIQHQRCKGVTCWYHPPPLQGTTDKPAGDVPATTDILVGDAIGNMMIWNVYVDSRGAWQAKLIRTFPLSSTSRAEPRPSNKGDSGDESGLPVTDADNETEDVEDDTASRDDVDTRATSVASSRNGLFLASGSANGVLTVYYYNPECQWQSLPFPPTEDAKQIPSLQFSSIEGENLLAYASGLVVYLCYLDPITLIPDSNIDTYITSFSGHSDDVESVAFSPDGRTIASGGDDNMINFWRVSDDHRLKITCLSTSAAEDGQLVITGSVDRTVRIRDKANGELKQVLRGATDAIFDIIFLSSDLYIVVVDRSGHITLWKKQDGGYVNVWNNKFTFVYNNASFFSRYCEMSRYTHCSSAGYTGFFSWLTDYWGSTRRIECWTVYNDKIVLAATGALRTGEDEVVRRIGHKKHSSQTSDAQTSKSVVVLVVECRSEKFYTATWKDSQNVPASGGNSSEKLDFVWDNTVDAKQCTWQEHDLAWCNMSRDGQWVLDQKSKEVLWVPPVHRSFGCWDGYTLLLAGESGSLAVVDFTGVNDVSLTGIVQ